MKIPNLLKNLALPLLAGACVLFLMQTKSCMGSLPKEGAAPTTIHDTIFVSEQGPIQWVVKKIHLVDSVFIPSPTLVDTPTLLLFVGDERIDSTMHLYQGEVTASDSVCTYKYLAGVDGDSLSFLSIESDCTKEVPTLTLTPPIASAGKAKAPANFGLKVGWSPSDPSSWAYGLQGSWRGAYLGVNFTPDRKAWMFETGVMVPIRSKKLVDALTARPFGKRK